MSNKTYTNLLTLEQCTSVANSMLKLCAESKLNYETDNYYYRNSYGYSDLPEAIDLLPIIDPIIKNDHPGFEFETVYTRIYQNDSTLTFHTDRSNLYLTLSVCMFTDVNEPWPLIVSTVPHKDSWNNNIPFEWFSHDCIKHITPVGTGVTCFGTVFPHWREPLKCKEDQKVIQSFYHWNRISTQ